jgi:hypothetical protein
MTYYEQINATVNKAITKDANSGYARCVGAFTVLFADALHELPNEKAQELLNMLTKVCDNE